MIIHTIKALFRPLKKALQKNPDRFLENVSGIVHIGANTGQERNLYNTHGLSVIWVEPIPDVFDILNANIQGFKNQRAFQALVTDVDDREYEFNIANNNGVSSSILDLKHHKDIWPSVDYTTTIHLKSTTLATLFKRERLDPSKYQALVMDTQGSELLVLRGCIPIIDNFTFIKTEVSDFESYKGCCQISDINIFMTEHGYKEFYRKKLAGRADVGSYFDIVYIKV